MEVNLINKDSKYSIHHSLKSTLIEVLFFLEKKYSRVIKVINYCFMNSKDIRSINNSFLGYNQSTDVLSFFDDDFLKKKSIESKKKENFHIDNQDVDLYMPPLDINSVNNNNNQPKWIAGDIALCLEVIEKNARQNNTVLPKYLIEVILHGTLHLLGLRHTYTDISLNQVYLLQYKLMGELNLNYNISYVKNNQ